MTRISKEDYGLALAAVVALRAACTRRQVGAVVIDERGVVVSTGYNGTAPGERECSDGGCPRGFFDHDDVPPGLGNSGHSIPCFALHAERNAVVRALERGADLARCVIYLTTTPCLDCAAMLAHFGLQYRTQPSGLTAKPDG